MVLKYYINFLNLIMGITRTLIGGVYVHIFMFCPISLFWSPIDQFDFELKETRLAEHEYINIRTPPLINVLVTALNTTRTFLEKNFCLLLWSLRALSATLFVSSKNL